MWKIELVTEESHEVFSVEGRAQRQSNPEDVQVHSVKEMWIQNKDK